jgi:hypothetical protein
MLPPCSMTTGKSGSQEAFGRAQVLCGQGGDSTQLYIDYPPSPRQTGGGYLALCSSRAQHQGAALGIFHRPGGNAVGPIEEVGIVGRPTGDEEEVLLWAFQGRNGRIGLVLQML